MANENVLPSAKNEALLRLTPIEKGESLKIVYEYRELSDQAEILYGEIGIVEMGEPVTEITDKYREKAKKKELDFRVENKPITLATKFEPLESTVIIRSIL